MSEICGFSTDGPDWNSLAEYIQTTHATHDLYGDASGVGKVIDDINDGLNDLITSDPEAATSLFEGLVDTPYLYAKDVAGDAAISALSPLNIQELSSQTRARLVQVGARALLSCTDKTTQSAEALFGLYADMRALPAAPDYGALYSLVLAHNTARRSNFAGRTLN